MIKSFRHSGIEKFFTTGSKAGIQPSHAAKLSVQLFQLSRAKDSERHERSRMGTAPFARRSQGPLVSESERQLAFDLHL